MQTPSPALSERSAWERPASRNSAWAGARAWALAVGALLAPAAARADVDLKFSGWISSDMRFRVLGEERAPPNPVPSGFSDLSDIDSTTLRNRVDPYYLEVHAAFIDVNNLFGDVIPRFDLRIGRQTVP